MMLHSGGRRPGSLSALGVKKARCGGSSRSTKCNPIVCLTLRVVSQLRYYYYYYRDTALGIGSRGIPYARRGVVSAVREKQSRFFPVYVYYTSARTSTAAENPLRRTITRTREREKRAVSRFARFYFAQTPKRTVRRHLGDRTIRYQVARPFTRTPVM